MPVAEDLEGVGVEVRRLLDEVLLGLLPLLQGDRELTCGREPVECVDDHPGLGGVHLAGLQRTCQHLVGLEPLGELEVRTRRSSGLPGLDRQPVRRRAGALLGGGTGALCLGEQLQLQRRDLALQDAPGRPAPRAAPRGSSTTPASQLGRARARARAAKSRTGCTRVRVSVGVLDMTQFQHRPLTVSASDLRF